jgi:hypothetical protein
MLMLKPDKGKYNNILDFGENYNFIHQPPKPPGGGL